MSRNLLVLAVGIIAVLVIVGFVFTPTTQQGFNFELGLIGEDANGNPVNLPFSWWIGGVEVVNIRPTASWSCSGEGVDWSTLLITGDFSILRLDYSGQTETDITPSGIGRTFVYTGSANKEGSTYFSVSCDSLLSGVPVSGVDSDLNEYWNLKITISMTGFVEQEGNFGEDLTATFTDSIVFSVKWIDGSFSIGGGITR